MSDSIGARLKATREAAGLDRSELNELAGLSPALVGMIERGDRTNIAATTAIALARVLGTTAEYLITGEGDPPSETDAQAAAARARAGASAPAEIKVDRSGDFNQTGTEG